MSRSIYRLADVAFVLRNSAPELNEYCNELLIKMEHDDNPYELDNCADLRDVVNQILRLHANCIWIDAAALLSTAGKQILLSGLSCSGKSTTAMALSLGSGWQIFSEDIVLLNYKLDHIISFAAPFSCKAGTVKRLEELIGGEYHLIDGEWLSSKGKHAPQKLTPQFDLCIHFSLDNPGTEIEANKISPATYIRRVVRCSNLVHDNEGAERFSEYIANAECFELIDGTLAERVQFILNAHEQLL